MSTFFFNAMQKRPNIPVFGVPQEMGGQGAQAFVAAAAEYFLGANWALYCYATMENGTAHIINLYGTPKQKEN
jgi:alkylation response protein AidB-like acyl-CoA dehydrogenase